MPTTTVTRTQDTDPPIPDTPLPSSIIVPGTPTLVHNLQACADQAPTAVAAAVATTHAMGAREAEDHDSVLDARSAKEQAFGSTTDHDQAVPRDDVFRSDMQLAFAALPDVKPNWTHKYAS